MWILIGLWACAGPQVAPLAPSPLTPPADLPANTGTATLDRVALRVDGVPIATSETLLATPTADTIPPLIDALSGSEALWVGIEAEVNWAQIRQLVHSADRAQVATVRLSDGERTFRPARSVRGTWRGACPTDARLVGVSPAWTLQIHRGPSELWMEAHARFRPLIASGDGPAIPIETLPPDCHVESASCEVLDGEARRSCASGQVGAARIAVAGEHGCLLPLAKNPGDEAGWEAPLAEWIRTFGIQGEDDVMLIPEATIPFSGITPTLAAFSGLDQPTPTLGRLLTEGNDGPPLCDVVIRDAEGLQRAAGAWLAGWLAQSPSR